jgi:hypothetical protein
LTAEGPAKRRLSVALLGAVLILIAAMLLAAVALPRRTPPVDAGAEARSACRAFGDVYAATRPGTPINARDLARKLEQATGEMHRAAAADKKWASLARSLDDLAAAVNAGDVSRSYSAMESIHDGCGRTERKA